MRKHATFLECSPRTGFSSGIKLTTTFVLKDRVGEEKKGKWNE